MQNSIKNKSFYQIFVFGKCLSQLKNGRDKTMRTVCQFFYYAPRHDLQSLLPRAYALVTENLVQ